jgi:hypothetical protein
VNDNCGQDAQANGDGRSVARISPAVINNSPADATSLIALRIIAPMAAVADGLSWAEETFEQRRPSSETAAHRS